LPEPIENKLLFENLENEDLDFGGSLNTDNVLCEGPYIFLKGKF